MSSETDQQENICKDIITDTERGEVICASTGEVIDSLIDSGPEWRDFQSSEGKSRSRAGTPFTSRMHDHGLATYTSEFDIKKLPYSKRRKFIELKRKNAAIRMSSKKRLVKALQLLSEEASKISVPEIVKENASKYIRKVIDKGLGRGEMIKAYIAASLFISCRVAKVPRAFASIAQSVGVDEQKARYAYRKIIEIQGGKIDSKVAKPKDYIPLISTKLKLSMQAQSIMYRLSNAVEKLNLLHGKSPVAIAASIAYISSAIVGEKRNQKDIADALGNFTDVAVRNRYREIVDNIYIEVAL